MKKILTAGITCLALIMAMIASPAKAVDVFENCTGDAANTSICRATNDDKLFGPGSIWNNILSTLTFIIGAVAVLMLIIGGLRYVTSNGEAQQVTSAKNTILYAVVGIVLAVMANAIVNFVLTNI